MHFSVVTVFGWLLGKQSVVFVVSIYETGCPGFRFKPIKPVGVSVAVAPGEAKISRYNNGIIAVQAFSESPPS